VYFFGYLPLLTNVLLLATKLELAVLVDELVSFLQEALKRQTNKMSTVKSRLIAIFLDFKVDQKEKKSGSFLLTIEKKKSLISSIEFLQK
jgi:hypothetical protein